MKTYYEVVVPFHFYESHTDKLVFTKQTEKEARQIKDDFIRYEMLNKQNHFDSAARILKYYDCYSDGTPMGTPMLFKVEKTEI